MKEKIILPDEAIVLSKWAIKKKITKEALKLLRKTIDRKWKRIVKKENSDNGSSNCYLCKKFLYKEFTTMVRKIGKCKNCPIRRKTGRKGCYGTPYMKWLSHQHRAHPKSNFPFKVKCTTCKKLAQKEVDWLEALYKECIKNEKVRLVFEEVHFIKTGKKHRYLVFANSSFKDFFFQREFPFKMAEWSNTGLSVGKIVKSAVSYLSDKGFKCQKVSRDWWSVKGFNKKTQRKHLGFSLFLIRED